MLGVYYFDPASGQSKLLAAPSDAAVGELLPPNQIVYRSAFNSDLLKADLRYTYTKSGFESEVILTAQPKLSPADCGFDPSSAWLQVRHQWAVPVVPQIRTITDAPGPSDQLLDFGELWFPRGRAFAVGSGSARPTNVAATVTVARPGADGDVPVGKEWQQGSPSSTLVESVLWTSIAPKLSALPLMASRGGPTATNLVASGRSASMPPKAKASASRPIRLASAPYRGPGLVLDYTITGGYGDYTFQTYDPNQGNYYYVPGAGAYFSGTVTFQPGCLIQFQNGGYLLLYGGIVCNGSQSSPSYLTSYTDQRLFPGWNAWGYPLPAIGDVSTALQFYYIPTNVTVNGMSISFATTAIEFDAINSSLTETVSATALYDCQTGIYDRKNCCNISIVSSAANQVATPTYSACGGNLFTGSFSSGSPPGPPPAVTCLTSESGSGVQCGSPFSPPTLVDWYVNRGLGNNYVGSGLSYWISTPQYGGYTVSMLAKNPFGAYNYPTGMIYSIAAPDSFESSVLTSFLNNTYGKTSSLWGRVPHENPPQNGDMQWNANALVYGKIGFTAISQLNSWTPWNASAQSWDIGGLSCTAISRRHGIMRGDGMGGPGPTNSVNGMTVWFVDADNQLVTATVAGTAYQGIPAGYVIADGVNYCTVVLFSEDLPQDITPMWVGGAPLDTAVYFQTSQLSPAANPGGVAALGPGVACAADAAFNSFWKPLNGGDSGSPMMLPTPDDYLVLFSVYSGGFTPSALQPYMDYLCDQQSPSLPHYELQVYTGYPQ